MALVDEWRSSKSEVDDFLLAYFPHCLEDFPSLLWDLSDALDGPIRSNQFVPYLRGPKILANKIVHEIAVDAYEFSSQYSTGIDISCVSFKGLVVAEDLASTGSGHRGD